MVLGTLDCSTSAQSICCDACSVLVWPSIIEWRAAGEGIGSLKKNKSVAEEKDLWKRGCNRESRQKNRSAGSAGLPPLL